MFKEKKQSSKIVRKESIEQARKWTGKEQEARSAAIAYIIANDSGYETEKKVLKYYNFTSIATLRRLIKEKCPGKPKPAPTLPKERKDDDSTYVMVSDASCTGAEKGERSTLMYAT